MGKIIRNKIEYGGGSGEDIPVYTTEEYEQIKDTIPEGTKFIISDDYQEEVKLSDIGNIIRKPMNFTKNIFFGDSITYGYVKINDSYTQAVSGYPKVFCDYCGTEFSNFGVTGAMYSAGVSGSHDFLSDIKAQEAILNTYDTLFLAGGVNDYCWAVSLSNFKAAVELTFNYIEQHFDGDVIIIGPWNVTEWSEQPVADLFEYRKILYESCLKRSKFNFINPVDFTPNTPNIYYRPDGVHPSLDGYIAIGKKLYDTLVNIPINFTTDNKSPVPVTSFNNSGLHMLQFRKAVTVTINTINQVVDLKSLMDERISNIVGISGFVYMTGGSRLPLPTYYMKLGEIEDYCTVAPHDNGTINLVTSSSFNGGIAVIIVDYLTNNNVNA